MCLAGCSLGFKRFDLSGSRWLKVRGYLGNMSGINRRYWNRVSFQSKEIDSFKQNMFLQSTMREGVKLRFFSLAELFPTFFITINYRTNRGLEKGNKVNLKNEKITVCKEIWIKTVAAPSLRGFLFWWGVLTEKLRFGQITPKAIKQSTSSIGSRMHEFSCLPNRVREIFFC